MQFLERARLASASAMLLTPTLISKQSNNERFISFSIQFTGPILPDLSRLSAWTRPCWTICHPLHTSRHKVTFFHKTCLHFQAVCCSSPNAPMLYQSL